MGNYLVTPPTDDELGKLEACAPLLGYPASAVVQGLVAEARRNRVSIAELKAEAERLREELEEQKGYYSAAIARLDKVRDERNVARRNYQWMVDHAADEYPAPPEEGEK